MLGTRGLYWIVRRPCFLTRKLIFPFVCCTCSHVSKSKLSDSSYLNVNIFWFLSSIHFFRVFLFVCFFYNFLAVYRPKTN